MIDLCSGLMEMMNTCPTWNRPNRGIALRRRGCEPGTSRVEDYACRLRGCDPNNGLPGMCIEDDDIRSTISREPATIGAKGQRCNCSGGIGQLCDHVPRIQIPC